MCLAGSTLVYTLCGLKGLLNLLITGLGITGRVDLAQDHCCHPSENCGVFFSN